MVYNNMSVGSVKDQETKPHVQAAMHNVNGDFWHEPRTAHNTTTTYCDIMRAVVMYET